MNDNKRQTISGSEDTLSKDNQQQEDIRQNLRRSVASGLDMQFATVLDRTTMPTPEAAKMTRYADFPVSPSLGTADISIPIYEINTGKLKLPISLQYSTSGIKVNEVSGPVGLGWHLNAGGVITRTICGVRDCKFPNVEELWTIGYDEARTRIAIGEISKPEQLRNSHSGSPVYLPMEEDNWSPEKIVSYILKNNKK